MKDENNNSGKSRRNIFIIILIILASAIILTIVFFSFKSGIIQIPGFVKTIFGINGSKDEYKTEIYNDIPEITPDNELINESYLNIEAAQALEILQESDSYKRTIRIIYLYENERNVIKYTISKDGGMFTAESNKKTIRCDGDLIKISMPVGEFTYETTEADLYEEIGITSLSEIKADLSRYNHEIKLSDNKKYIRASILNESGNITAEYDISTEYGLVVSEYHYEDGELYRLVVTDSITYLDD